MDQRPLVRCFSSFACSELYVELPSFSFWPKMLPQYCGYGNRACATEGAQPVIWAAQPGYGAATPSSEVMPGVKTSKSLLPIESSVGLSALIGLIWESRRVPLSPT